MRLTGAEAKTIYMFTDGEYSDYDVVLHLEGPSSVDIEPYCVSAEKEHRAEEAEYWRSYNENVAYDWGSASAEEKVRRSALLKTWKSQNPPPRGVMARLIEMLEPLGFREIDVVEVHEYQVRRPEASSL